MSEIDISKLGLKCGIEIHQQLDTAHKLFCNCASRFSTDKPAMTIIRRLRPVAGETGDIDRAALHEIMRNMEFHYAVYPSESCLVETDEEPPHDLNTEALDIALTVAMLMNCEIPDEIHVMRKTVIDGSNTAGFQRTAIVGLDGKINTSGGDVGITNLSVEEESCQILSKEKNVVVYGLDRLGIPLVEIGTSPDIHTPRQAMEVAEKLGMIVRSTGKAKRGLGTIRQDINISIKGGARVEIKGSQDLKLIPKLVELEALRQASLLGIMHDLKKSGFRPAKHNISDVSKIFAGSESKITKEKQTNAMIIPGLSGFFKHNLTPTKTLGNEIAGYVRAKTELKGIIHSDEELGKYKLEKEFAALADHLGATGKDMLIIAAGEKQAVEKAFRVVVERVNQLLEGVPEETRRALDSGDTEYMRPLPGAARLYPETDVLPISIDSGKLSEIKKNLPELLDQKMERERGELSKHGISREIIKQLVHAGRKHVFDELVASGADPSLAATTLTSTLRSLERKEKANTKNITNDHLKAVFMLLGSGRISKEAIPGLLKELSEHPHKTADEIASKSGMAALSDHDLSGIIKRTINENSNLLADERGQKILLGLVMQKVRGKADSKKVMEMLSAELRKK
jgi:glutamyl-tRNA(Gln) amidotransferase subunit E